MGRNIQVRSRIYRVALETLCALMVPALFLAFSTLPAAAYSSSDAPAAMISHYVTNESGNDVTDNNTWGGIAKTDAQNGRSGIVTLGFGAQKNNSGWKVLKPRTTTEVPDSAVTNIGKAYIYGWYANSTASQTLVIGIGTNNSNTVTTAAADEWASIVAGINTWVKQAGYNDRVTVRAASDMEVAYNTETATVAWVDEYNYKYQTVTDVPAFFNYGDAAACPTSGTTATSGDGVCSGGNTWHQSKIYHISWGLPSAFAVPEIYTTDGNQAKQWQQISTWGYYHDSVYGKINFSAPMTQAGACSQPGNTCTGTNNSSGDGWSQLMNAINCTSPMPVYNPCVTVGTFSNGVTDIRYN